MAAGYVYVLVNSSTPGLVKVGKTARDPEGRAAELSRATGVAVPFVLAYDRYFQDCDAAELLAHRQLKERGWRPSDSREFFAAKVSDVIKILIDLPDTSISSDAISPRLDEDSGERPWAPLLELASRLVNGKDTIRDTDRALQLYQQALALGSWEAAPNIARLVYTKSDGYRRAREVLLRALNLGLGDEDSAQELRAYLAVFAADERNPEDFLSAMREWLRNIDLESTHDATYWFGLLITRYQNKKDIAFELGRSISPAISQYLYNAYSEDLDWLRYFKHGDPHLRKEGEERAKSTISFLKNNVTFKLTEYKRTAEIEARFDQMKSALV
jgi:hypothetical protein